MKTELLSEISLCMLQSPQVSEMILCTFLGYAGAGGVARKMKPWEEQVVQDP